MSVDDCDYAIDCVIDYDLEDPVGAISRTLAQLQHHVPSVMKSLKWSDRIIEKEIDHQRSRFIEGDNKPDAKRPRRSRMFFRDDRILYYSLCLENRLIG